MEFEKRKETLDLSVIEYVSELAKIELSPFEKEIYAKDLNDVIAFADAIANIDVSTYEPLNYVGGGENVLREDEVKHSLSPQNVLQNAPSQYENCFFVPKTVE
jgi:aspartyl/glutamyl-tRNA(Asn/Gln) amidotransferase C subunit